MLCTLVGRSDLIGMTVLKSGLNSKQWRGLAYQERQAVAGETKQKPSFRGSEAPRHHAASPTGAAKQKLSSHSLARYQALFASQDLSGSEILWFMSLFTDLSPVD